MTALRANPDLIQCPYVHLRLGRGVGGDVFQAHGWGMAEPYWTSAPLTPHCHSVLLPDPILTPQTSRSVCFWNSLSQTVSQVSLAVEGGFLLTS